MAQPVKLVFVCLHGAAKSVVAAELFRRHAADRGLEVEALARGLEPDPTVSPAAAEGLGAEGIDVRAVRPRGLRREDLVRAARVVTFACDVGPLLPPGVPVEDWPDVPAVSEGYPAARAALVARFPRLLEGLPVPPGQPGARRHAGPRSDGAPGSMRSAPRVR
jgi:hypothetical protein